MQKNTGHIIRICGLVIEMLGVLVYTSGGDTDQARLSLPGGTAVPLAWVAVGLGFVLWLTGTIIIYATRTRRKSRTADD